MALSIALDYYRATFEHLERTKGSEIERALLSEPKELRLQFWLQHPDQEIANPEESWTVARAYASVVERRIQDIVKRHSLFYWIHLYRRIGVYLHPGHSPNVDANTLLLVRDILECAFIRFASLTKIGDVQYSLNMSPTKILGGQYLRRRNGVLRKLSRSDRQAIPMTLPAQWVITEFSSDDYVDIYRLEGLAYEYWWVTALMRALGKGAVLSIRGGHVHQRCSSELLNLLASYDRRIWQNNFSSSLLGTLFNEQAQRNPHWKTIVLLRYNVDGEKYSTLFPRSIASAVHSLRGTPNGSGPAFPEVTDFVPNFKLGRMDIGGYVEAHAFASEGFTETHGFHFEDLCLLITAVCEYFVADQAIRPGIGDAQKTIELLKRAYQDFDGPVEGLSLLLLKLVRRSFSYADLDRFEIALPKIMQFITLSAERQPQVALWSRGPRFIFIPHGSRTIIDLQGIPSILNSLFVKVRYKQTLRGVTFEEGFRVACESSGLNLLPARQMRSINGAERETDAAVRSGTTLYLCDCRTIERPLDFEIGRPKTMEGREELLSQKLERVKSIREFVTTYPKGTNYDFTWATEIRSIGVSPFVEWISSREPDRWIDYDADLPWILSVQEALVAMEPPTTR